MENLIRIVHKISNYVPWQLEGLTEEEFRVLDQAKGIELANIAYENRLNFNRFLKNADKMIDKYNEQLIQTQLKEVRALKRTLQSNVPFNIKKVEHVERIVPEIQNVPEIEPQINEIEQQMNAIHCESAAAQVVPEVRTFQSMLTEVDDDISKSVPVHRDAIRPTNGVTLDENRAIPNASNNSEIIPTDEMPILNKDELAKMGVYTLAHSKRPSRIQEFRKSASNLEIPQIEIVPPREVTNDNIPLEPIENIESLQIDEHVQRVQEMDHGIQSLAINEPEQIQQPSLAEQQQVEEPNINVLRRSSSTNIKDSMAGRWEDFRLAADAADVMLGKAKKRIKRPQRVQKKQVEEDDDELSLFKLRKDVPNKNKRRNRVRPVKYFKQHNLISNIFDDMDIYLQNDLPLEDEQIIEEEVEVMPQQQANNRVSDFNEFNLELNQPGANKHRVVTSTPMNLTTKKRTNVSPEQSQHSKRMRTLESIQEIQDPSIVQPENIAAIPECPELVTDPGITIPNVPSSIQESNILPPIIEDPIELPLLPSEPLERQVDPSIEIPVQIPEDHEILLSIEPPSIQQSTNNPELSKDQSLPRKLTRLAVLENLHITSDSIDYDRLRRNSELRKTPLDDRLQIAPGEIFQNAVENISDREAGKSQRAVEVPITRTQRREVMPRQLIEEPFVPQLTENFTDMPKIMMNGEYHYELMSNDGSRKIYVNESRLKCIRLYLKIRIIMKSVKGTASPWKMTIKEVFGHLKELNEPKFVTYQRLKYLTQQKLLIAECSENGLDLLGIEIPINIFEDANDKENNP